MILLIAIWLLISLYSIILGNVFTLIIQKVCAYNIKDIFSRLLIGLSILIVYAQLFSIFYKVGIIAHLILLLFCFIGILILHKSTIPKGYFFYNSTKKSLLVSCLIILIIAYFSAQKTIYYDTELYHAQAIRWIEEYGVVKGLGNLHNRFAYNSSMFALTALFSFSDILGTSLRPINGYISCFLLLYILHTLPYIKKHIFSISSFIKLMSSCYLIYNLNALSSPNSDTITLILMFLLITIWFELLESQETKATPYALICIGFIVAVSLKISVVIFLLLAFYPALTLIKQKNFKQIVFFISTGILCILPFLIRNVLISGYLVYPYASIDLFHFDWKMPKRVVEFDYQEIQVWGRGLKNVAMYNIPFSKWFPQWYADLDLSNQIIFFSSILTSMLLVISNGILLYKRKIQWYHTLSCVIPLCTSIFWMISAPLFRYGIAFLLLNIGIGIGFIFTYLSTTKYKKHLLYLVIGIYISFITLHFSMINLNTFTNLNLFKQPDYAKHPVQYIILEDKIPIYYPKDGSDFTGYYAFPSTPNSFRLDSLELRGENLCDGFRAD